MGLKKNWRKKIDITSIEKALESNQHELRTFGTQLQSLKSEDLFILDIKGDASKAVKKPLRIDEIISSKSKVPAVYGKQSTAPIILNFNGKTRKISKFQKMAFEKQIKLKNNIKGIEKKPFIVKETKYIDAWEIQKESDLKLLNIDFIPDAFKPIPKKPKLPNLVGFDNSKSNDSHPGISINPRKQDHQDLLKLAFDFEDKRILDIEKANKEMSYPESFNELIDSMLNEKEEEEEEEEQIEVDENKVQETPFQNLASIPENRKTKTERNKEKRKKDMLQKSQDLIERKRLDKQILDLESLNQIKPKKKRLEKVQRLGPLKYQIKEPVFTLSEDLTESMRAVKPQANLFMELFKDFEQKGKIETRTRQNKKRKYPLKHVEIHSYKRFI